jgi:ATP-dependent Clp protease ATP-binding subunit ClpA
MWLSRLVQPEPTRPPVPLTADGWRAFGAAVRAARRNQHEYVGTEHLLVGLAEAGPSPAAEALARAGITAEAICRQCSSDPGLGLIAGALPLTPTAERVLAAALRDAERGGAAEVGSLGLLLALARDESGVARELLARVVAAEAEPRATPSRGGKVI